MTQGAATRHFDRRDFIALIPWVLFILALFVQREISPMMTKVEVTEQLYKNLSDRIGRDFDQPIDRLDAAIKELHGKIEMLDDRFLPRREWEHATKLFESRIGYLESRNR